MVTEIRNRMEQNGLFHSFLFRILHPEAILYLSLNLKNCDLGTLTLSRNFFVNNRKIMECSVLFPVLVTAITYNVHRKYFACLIFIVLGDYQNF